MFFEDGKKRVIVPAGAVWDDFFDAPGGDLPEREQPRALQCAGRGALHFIRCVFKNHNGPSLVGLNG
jgi:hypothetical protein